MESLDCQSVGGCQLLLSFTFPPVVRELAALTACFFLASATVKFTILRRPPFFLGVGAVEVRSVFGNTSTIEHRTAAYILYFGEPDPGSIEVAVNGLPVTGLRKTEHLPDGITALLVIVLEDIPWATAVPDESYATLCDLARAGDEVAFRDLASCLGVPKRDLDDLWLGTRARIGKEGR